MTVLVILVVATLALALFSVTSGMEMVGVTVGVGVRLLPSLLAGMPIFSVGLAGRDLLARE